MIRKLLALLGFWPLVYTQDHDGEIRIRIARPNPFGGWMCDSIYWENAVTLLSDGKTSGITYVERWIEWRHNRKHVVFDGVPTEAAVRDLLDKLERS